MTNINYIITELQENYNDGFWWRNRVLHRVVGPLQRGIYGGECVNVMEQEWDNLIILDACRADYFEDVANLNNFSKYRVVNSCASATPEFVQKTFAGHEFGDTVYVNSNPHISRDAPGSFHQRYDLWANDFDETFSTVLPETTKARAIEVAEAHPEKRLIVHYNQPHGPYIGENRIEWDTSIARGSGEALKKGLVTEKAFRKAYRENLEIALPTAIELAIELDGRSVITADHGELFGKRMFPIPIRAYAHPMGLRDPDLIRVPWAVIDGTRRKKITDEGTSVRRADKAEISERLADLGYKS